MELTDKQKEQMETAWRNYFIKIKEAGTHTALQRAKLRPSFNDGYTAAVNRECAWTWIEDETVIGLPSWRSVCGIETLENLPNFCPNCGGKVVEGNI